MSPPSLNYLERLCYKYPERLASSLRHNLPERTLNNYHVIIYIKKKNHKKFRNNSRLNYLWQLRFVGQQICQQLMPFLQNWFDKSVKFSLTDTESDVAPVHAAVLSLFLKCSTLDTATGSLTTAGFSVRINAMTNHSICSTQNRNSYFIYIHKTVLSIACS